MVVEIDYDHDGTGVDDDGEGGFLILKDPDKGMTYASWPFHVTPSQHYIHDSDVHVWKWENPDEPIEDITLAPSLKLEWDDPNTFHIFIWDGEVEHCGDCQCGCQS